MVVDLLPVLKVFCSLLVGLGFVVLIFLFFVMFRNE